MAEITEIIDSMKAKFASLGPVIENLKAQIASLGEGEALENKKKELAAVEGKAGRLQSAISALSGAFAKFTGMSKETGAAMSQLHPAFTKFGAVLKNDIGVAIKNSAELIGVSLSPAMRALYNPVDQSTDALGMLGVISKTAAAALKGLDEASKNLIRVQDNVRTAFVTGGRSMEDANKAAKTYAQGLRDASSATAFGAKDIDEFNKVVGKHMPKEMMMGKSSVAEVTDIMGKSVMPTTVAMTAFRAFGITGTDAAKKTEDAILKFNQAPVETARQLGLMKRAANAMGVNMGVAREQIVKASSHMAIFGQKTGSATGMWSTFMGALKDKVPVEEVGKIVADLTGKLAKMSMQNRAFISMMSGMGRGSTALGGALKMELAMRGPEGMQKHLQGLTRTLGRFAGGRVISLEQAAQNPQLEQQFVLQRQMLGKLAGITDQEQQNRVLETLQKVQSGGMTQVEASGALKEVLKGGKSLQEKQLTVLEKMLQHMRAAFGGRLDTKLDEATKTIRKGFGPLQKALQDQAGDPNRNVMNKDAFISGMRGMARKVGLAVKQVVRAPIKVGDKVVGRYGKEGVEPTRPGLSRRILGSAGLREAIGARRRALRPSDRAAGRVRAPTARRPAAREGRVKAPVTRRRAAQARRTGAPVAIRGFRTLTTNITQGNQTIHRDMQRLIRTTRDGLSALKEGKAGEPTVLGGTKAAEAGEKTITIRIVGDDQKVLEKLGSEIEKSMKEYEVKQQKNTLGIGG